MSTAAERKAAAVKEAEAAASVTDAPSVTDIVAVDQDGVPSTDAPGGVDGLDLSDASVPQEPEDFAAFVRLVPADWTVAAVEFDVDVEGEDEPLKVRIARPEGGAPGYVVAAASADHIIAAAGARGLAVSKEPIA